MSETTPALQIQGYRQLTEEEVKMINGVKQVANEVGNFVQRLMMVEGVDLRWLGIARTDLQKGFMAMTRAIAKPEGF